MLVPLVITPLDNLSSMRFVLLLRCVGQKANVIVDVEVEQRTRLSTGFIHDEIVESVMLEGC